MDYVKTLLNGILYKPRAMRSNWNASDGEEGYIENRPFYEAQTRTLYDGETTFDLSGGRIAAEISVQGSGYPRRLEVMI